MRVLLLVLFTLSLVHCKSQDKGETKGASTILESKSSPKELARKQRFPFNLPKVEDEAMIRDLRDRFAEVLVERHMTIKSDGSELTDFFVTPRGLANQGKRIGPKNFEGMWAKFSEDNTYQYGVGQYLIGQGVYHFSDSDRLLMMLDSDAQIEPRLWTLLGNSDFFNFLGRPVMFVKAADGQAELVLSNWASEYYMEQAEILVQGHNGMQIMMSKTDTKPAAPNQ